MSDLDARIASASLGSTASALSGLQFVVVTLVAERLSSAGWLATLIDWEEQERTRRSLERRLRAAHIGRFKPLCDFDWTWPKRCDRSAFEALMANDFLKDATNAILVGPNGVGKSTHSSTVR